MSSPTHHYSNYVYFILLPPGCIYRPPLHTPGPPRYSTSSISLDSLHSDCVLSIFSSSSSWTPAFLLLRSSFLRAFLLGNHASCLRHSSTPRLFSTGDYLRFLPPVRLPSLCTPDGPSFPVLSSFCHTTSLPLPRCPRHYAAHATLLHLFHVSTTS